jgi:hypothetical protein
MSQAKICGFATCAVICALLLTVGCAELAEETTKPGFEPEETTEVEVEREEATERSIEPEEIVKAEVEPEEHKPTSRTGRAQANGKADIEIHAPGLNNL